jgi:Protein of unknown function (DUF3071)
MSFAPARPGTAERTPMQELRLVAVSEDGSYAVLAVPGRSGRFTLPIDDRLRTVARGQFSRLAQYEIEVERPLRPKEIQDRIRAGETADEIADAAGLPLERVRRFEGPVLAEREFRAREAQQVTVRGQGDAGPGPRLGDIVAERLAGAGASADDAQWDSRKRSDGNWQIELQYAVGGRPQVAEWVFDPRRRHVVPADDHATRLSLAETEWPPTRPGARGPTTATVTPIGSRLAAPAQQTQAEQAEPRADLDWRARSAAGSPQLTPAAAAGAVRPASSPASPPPPPAHAAAAPGSGAAAPAAPDQAHERGADPPRPDEAPEAAARPARRAAGGRSRRSSVPSWDEIMFGNSRQPD